MARSWLKVEGTVGDHPKVVALAGLYAVHPDLVVGPLVRWWHYCTEYGRAGEPAKCHADVMRSYFAPVVKLSRALTIPDVVDALRSVGLMDEDGNPNDWQDYGGAILAKRAQDAGRQRVKRAIAKGSSEVRHADVTRQSRGRVEKAFTASPGEKAKASPEHIRATFKAVLAQSADDRASA